MTKAATLCLLLAFPILSFSQTQRTAYKANSSSPHWMQLMYSENPNVREVVEAYDAYYEVNPFEKNEHTQYYKRWLRERHGRTDQDGNMLKHNFAEEDAIWEQQHINKSLPPSDSWEEAGPWQYDHETAMLFEVQSPGAAHVYTVEQSLSNPDVVFAGTATAGLWRSTNKGMHWELLTHDLYVNSVYAIAIHPTDTDIIYFGEENGDIWKSTNAGVNWVRTGSAAFQNADKWTRQLMIDPLNPSILWAATNAGLFRTINGGNTWNLIANGEWMELEVKPNDASIMYGVKLVGDQTEFHRSTNEGVSFAQVINGWPTPASGGDHQRRCEISVTPANPNLIYVHATGQVGANSGLWGIYKSYDAGLSFTFECCGTGPVGAPAANSNPNTMGWSEDGSSGGGQYYYDMASAVSPTNENLVYTGGINVWRSDNGGSEWSLNAHWVTWVSQQTKDRYTHADVHDIKFFETAGGVDMWVASDGGLFYSANQGSNMEPRMYGIHGTDFWGFQSGFQDGDVMIGGTYHNGTLVKNRDLYSHGKDDIESGGWLGEGGGDNIRGFVNFGNNDIVYSDQGKFELTDVREERMQSQAFDGAFACNTSYFTGEYGNYEWDPCCYNHFYSPVGNSIYKTTNDGFSFELLHTFPGIEKVIQIKVASSDPNRMYCTAAYNYWDHTMFRSIDGGQNWVEMNIASGVSGGNQWRHKYIAVDENNPAKIWVALLGAQANYKVFSSSTSGQTWQNITSTALGTLDVVNISHQMGTDEGLYVGTRHGVYYKNATMGDWVSYATDMPARTSAFFLEPYYGEGKLRTATQRGVFEAPFHEASQPVARVAADKLMLNIGSSCETQTVQFVDHSVLKVDAASTWEWTFEGGVPATSLERNPVVEYPEAGQFAVTLIITDANGTATVTKPDFITVTNEKATFPLSEDFEAAFPPLDWKLYSPESSDWEHGQLPNDASNKTMSFPNYWVDASGADVYAILPAMDFNEAVNPVLSFDYMYKNFGAGDSLAIKYRSSSEPEWTTLWQLGGNDLSASGGYIWWWYDGDQSSLDWQTANIDLSALLGESCVEIAFANIGANGNHIWVDNVLLDTDPKVDFDASAQNPCADESVVLNDLSTQNPDAWLWSFAPATVTYLNGTNATSQNPEVSFDGVGPYEVTLEAFFGGNGFSETKSDYLSVVGCDCEGDFNFDGERNGNDLVMLIAEFGCNQNCTIDLTDDDSTNVADLLIFLQLIGLDCE